MTAIRVAFPNLGMLLTILALTSVAVSAYAQQQSVIHGDRAVCTNCALRVEKVTELGTSGDVLLHQETRLAIDSRGVIYAAPTFDPGGIGVYNLNGQLIRQFGRQGRGPQEFSFIRRIYVDDTDSLHVIHSAYSLVSPQLEVVRTFPVVSAGDILRLNDFFLFQIWEMSNELAGVPIVARRADGTVGRSFDKTTRATVFRHPDDRLRRLAPSKGGRFWAAHVNRYLLELWDTSGVLVRTITRDATWFESDTVPRRGGASTSTGSRVLSIREDADGLLWLTILLADEHVASEPPPRTESEAAARRDFASLERRSDIMLEVLDPRNLTVRLSVRRPLMDLVHCIPNFCYGYSEDGIGRIRVNVWRVALTR